MANNILDSYIPKFFVELNRTNDDVIVVTTQYFSPEGDVYELDRRAVAPILVQTTQSLQELQPEVSNVYPFRIVTPLDFDGATLIMSPSITAEPTASQSYYAPIYFERYDPSVYTNISTDFSELVAQDLAQVAAGIVTQTPEEIDLTQALSDIEQFTSLIDEGTITINI